jgi:glycosyltransferase involved in cell wall biosynthesis
VRVLLVQRSLSPPGGGNGVAAWMVHALANWADVTTLTLEPWSVEDTNAFYGTAIPPGIARLTASRVWRPVASLPDDVLTRLRMCAVLGHARTLASQFDVMISADNFAAFAGAGMQYVHFPARLQPEPARLAPLVHLYFALCNRVLGAPWGDAVRNATLANSEWTARGLEALGEVTADVLYPPVIDPGPGLPWDERDNTFLCIGRFTPGKRIDVAISIVEAVRRSVMPDARLVVVGSAVDRRHTRDLHAIAAGRPWIEFREDLSRAALHALMGRSRYGLQPMIAEHFGMATAEMTRAGCLVFAHNSGGTPEVLDGETSLLWSSEQDAVERIAAANPRALQPRLRDRASMFLSDVFVERFRDLVSRYVSRLNSGSAINS